MSKLSNLRDIMATNEHIHGEVDSLTQLLTRSRARNVPKPGSSVTQRRYDPIQAHDAWYLPGIHR